jgi:hypothetical protein
MLQIRGGADLGEEALRPDQRGQLGLEDLQRDTSVVPEIGGEIHRRHSAFTDLSLDPVSACQRCVQTLERIHHAR